MFSLSCCVILYCNIFQLACRSGLEHRALELSGLMPSQQVVQLAVKYATKLGKRQLAERLTDEGTQHTDDFEDIHLQSFRSQPRYYSICIYTMFHKKS